MHRRKTQNLTPLVIPQLCPHDPVQSASNGLSSLVDKHTGIIIEAHNASVCALVLFLRSDYDCVSDVSSSDFVGC